jgi:hypothetical protein
MRVLLGGGDWGYWAPIDSRSETTLAQCVWFGAFGGIDAHATEMGAEAVIGDALDAAFLMGSTP